MKNGSVRIDILDRLITNDDMRLINNSDFYVMVKSCYFDSIDVSTLNINVVFIDCYFEDSEVVIPYPAYQLANCVFAVSNEREGNRQAIKQAKVISGYHTSVLPCKYF